MRTIPAGRFKAQCLKLLDEVAETGETIVVTKRGKPVAKIEPVEEPPSLAGSVIYLVDDDELLFSTGEIWDVERA
ncbi:MAG: type II toxin-antitoxin system Phd/YefM family antitoxin [Thermoleophilia bacterium]|nr:type II toxin-antitoxin system Phd/YefM family antitoxin [Thermoleophilia bacterium]MDH4340430.1 type II toxin-antitoxin system Phd/YefM family antitoxin [Thermoleophilia bacterium]MDH5280247.1 type II toxin-antitoxin system Phd/YefM family antitoxin [Thermoleophilia bacterium]